MRAILVRVGADQSKGGGNWNGPVDSETGRFVYVSIPETKRVHPNMEKPYLALSPFLLEFGVGLPSHLTASYMHLDPDFAYLTYGDQGQRAKQLKENVCPGDVIVFYSGLRDVGAARGLVYAIIGILFVRDLIFARDVLGGHRDVNAHSRRLLESDASDVVVRGLSGGRLDRCLNVGEYRDGAYRVRKDILDAWGGLSVKDGYLQRSARLPRFVSPNRFMSWFESQNVSLLQRNN